MKTYFFSILLLFFAYVALASDTLVVKDLSAGWKSIDPVGNVTPFEGSKSELLYIDIEEDLISYNLYLATDKPLDVWLNDQLITHKYLGSRIISLDSLKRGFGAFRGITLYQESGFSGNIETKIITVLSNSNLPDRNLRLTNAQLGDWYLIAILSLVILAGFYKRFYPVSFNHSFENPLVSKVRSISAEEAYFSFASTDNIATIIFFSFLFSTVVSYLGVEPVWTPRIRLFDYVYAWLFFVGSGMLLVFFKFLWCRILAELFQFSAISNVQIQDFMNFFIPIFTAALVITLIDFGVYDFTSEKFRSTVIYALIISQLFFIIWLFLKFDNFFTHKKLLIIFYLCTTEFLPGTLVIHWLGGLK